MYQKKDQLSELLLCLVDGLVIFISLFIAGMLRHWDMRIVLEQENFTGILGVLLLEHVVMFYYLRISEGFYDRDRYLEMLVAIKYNVILAVGSVIWAYCSKTMVFNSRLVFGYFCVINTILTYATHIVFRNVGVWFRWNEKNATSLVIVTTAQRLPEIAKRFTRSKETTWNVAGVLLVGDQELPEKWKHLHQISDDPDAYVEFATRNVVDEVFISLDSVQDREGFLKEMILTFEKMGIAVNLNLDMFDLGVTGKKRIYNLEQYNVIAFATRLFDYRTVLIKRIVDIVGALVGLLITFVVGIFLAPVLLLESPGPLIFKQKRVGVNGRTFDFYKFRSMYADAEARKKDLMAQNEMSGLMFKMENDPRITKVGAFIRKTSIDELPQFWNVLKGDMSLVGTRPPTVDEYQQYSYYQKRRISFRPGITGLWQISGRSDIKDFDEVVKLDLEYIDNWSLMLDIKILIKTVLIVLGRKGAH